MTNTAGTEQDFSEEKLESMMGKIRALLERADHPSTPGPEAELSRNRAEALMLKYRIAESTAVASGTSSNAPVWRTVVLHAADSEFATWYNRLAGIVLQHVGAKGVVGWTEDEHGVIRVKLEAVGYAADLNYLDVLLTSCMMEFGKRLEPRYDKDLTDEDNVYNMRHAGMERKRIAKVIFGDWETENEMKAKNRKVTRLFKSACEKRGEDWSVLLGRGNNVKTYRESYADGFVGNIHTRLVRQRTGATEVEGGGLVLRDRFEKVLEAYYLKFPQYRPSNTPRTGTTEPCAKCQAAKSGYCREHSYRRPVKAREQSWNAAAASRGRDAATAVDLGANSTGRGRVQKGDPKRLG